MPAMTNFERTREQRALLVAVAVSLVIHLLALFIPANERAGNPDTPSRLEARLAPPREAAGEAPQPPAKTSAAKTARSEPRRRVMTSEKSRPSAPPWSVAQKPKWTAFSTNWRNRPGQRRNRRWPSARWPWRAKRATTGADGCRRRGTLELRPNGQPVNAFSLEMYLEGLVRLNRSAGFVSNERRHKGVETAAVQFRINPDGSLKSFVVLNAGDQADEIAFIKAVIERSLPFSPFPPDIDQAARPGGDHLHPAWPPQRACSATHGNRCT
jgi:hypothetical protein